VKKNYGESSLFIGARGGSSRKPPRYDRCDFPEDTCPLRRFEGDVFYQNSKVFAKSDRQSQPASPRG
jgi:hypothetical protein